jgi:RNA polymerase sigma-70 factor (ECF subfamily)
MRFIKMRQLDGSRQESERAARTATSSAGSTAHRDESELASTAAQVYEVATLTVGSLEALYSRYSRSVWRRARRILGDDDAAKDVMQEVFLRAIAAEAKNVFDENPMAWLYRVTTNLCLNRLRDSNHRAKILSRYPVEETREEDADAPILLRRILEDVPCELQDIAVYHYVDELSHDEIACIVGMSRRTVGNRLAAFHSIVSRVVTQEAPV